MQNLLNLFKGRISRGSFSKKMFIFFILYALVGVIAVINFYTIKLPLSLFYIFIIPLFIIMLTFFIRRLHDLDKSSAYIVIPLLAGILSRIFTFVSPITSIIIVIFLYCLFLMKGTTGSNTYGEDPLLLGSDDSVNDNMKVRLFSLIQLWISGIPAIIVIGVIAVLSGNGYIMVGLISLSVIIFLALNIFIINKTLNK